MTKQTAKKVEAEKPTKKRRSYTNTFKNEALALYKSSGKSADEIEKDLGIGRGLLAKWTAQKALYEEEAFPGRGRQRELEAEIERLKREVLVLTQEREILKKAMGIVSQKEKRPIPL